MNSCSGTCHSSSRPISDVPAKAKAARSDPTGRHSFRFTSRTDGLADLAGLNPLPELAKLALRFTLSQPITAAIPPGDPGLFEMAVKLAQDFTPVEDSEIAFLRDRAAGVTPLASSDWLTPAR